MYLLGLYLGDGCISRSRSVWRLRIFQDERYTELIDEAAAAMRAISQNRSGRVRKTGCIELSSYWKHWPCVFPQHGLGRKHERPIVLEPWQRRLVEEHPREMLRGLVHSDGCRSTNRVRRPIERGWRWYEYTRYFFSNASPDIRALFVFACERVGVDCRPNSERNISVARRESVALLDSFIGPKR